LAGFSYFREAGGGFYPQARPQKSVHSLSEIARFRFISMDQFKVSSQCELIRGIGLRLKITNYRGKHEKQETSADRFVSRAIFKHKRPSKSGSCIANSVK
jgi:hypothetical protein